MKALHVFIGALVIAAVDVATYRYFKQHFVPGPATPIQHQPAASTVFRHDPAPARTAMRPAVDVMTVKRADLGQGFKCAGGLLYQTSEADGVKTITLHTVKGKPARCE